MMIHERLYDLLLEHDCVVVPGLGGFLCQYRPAEIDMLKGVVKPPARTIGFNKALQQNDGLLTQSLAMHQAVSYKEAEDQIRQFVQDIIDRLHSHGSVQLPGIGRLYQDNLQSMRFIPAQEPLPLDESFGLTTVVARPVPRMKIATAETQEAVAVPHTSENLEDVETPVVKMPVHRKWPYRVAAAVAGIFFAGSMWMSAIQTDVLSGLKAGFNPFALVETVATQVPLSVEVADEMAEIITEEVEVTVAEEGILQEELIPTLQTFTIVVGAFKGPITAGRYTEELLAQGWNSEVLGTPGEGLLKVVIHVEAADEITAVKEIRSKVEPEAWLLQ